MIQGKTNNRPASDHRKGLSRTQNRLTLKSVEDLDHLHSLRQDRDQLSLLDNQLTILLRHPGPMNRMRKATKSSKSGYNLNGDCEESERKLRQLISRFSLKGCQILLYSADLQLPVSKVLLSVSNTTAYLTFYPYFQ